MSRLSEYNPLGVVTIAGVRIERPSGVIAIVGPNSSGKTLFLRGVDHFLHTGKLNPVVCEGIEPAAPDDFGRLFDDLLESRLISGIPGTSKFQTFVPFLRNKQDRTPFTKEELTGVCNHMREKKNPSRSERFFRSLGMCLSMFLSLEERRSLCHGRPAVHYKSVTPDDPIQALQLHSGAQETLATETSQVFGNAVWLDITNPDILQLRVAGRAIRPSPGLMSNPYEVTKYHTIDREGDGYKSYVGLCLAMMLGVRPVLLIDEPEQCLHPPQAYHMGRFIGRHARTDHATFVATHSSHLLRGLLETGKRLTVVRLTQTIGKFQAHLADDKLIRSVVENPRSRAEAILDGVFAKGVIAVESEGDREVYQAACEAIPDYPARELHFITTGGTGFADPCRFYRSLHVPTAVVADLDAICEPEKMAATLDALNGGDAGGLAECVEAVKRAAEKAKTLPPPVTERQAVDVLKRLAGQTWNWNGGDDNKLRGELNELVNLLKRVRKLKEGGLEAYSEQPEVKALLAEMVDECKNYGVFLVPVGELEGWVSQLMADVPRRLSKTKRAAIAAERIRSADSKQGDVWAFVAGVAASLHPKMDTMAATAVP